MSGCAGIDRAKEEHAVRIVGTGGRKLVERGFAHDEKGMEELCRTLVEHGALRVAIERPEGALVERVLEAGVAVLAIHPSQLKASRARFRASGGKPDAFDAFCLAELARTDHRRFRALAPDSDETGALRALTRAREGLVVERVALANRLRAELEAFWPGAASVFSEIDSPICLAFLGRCPSPPDASRPGGRRLAAFLGKEGRRGRKDARELLERLRRAPAGRAGPRSRRAASWSCA